MPRDSKVVVAAEMDVRVDDVPASRKVAAANLEVRVEPGKPLPRDDVQPKLPPQMVVIKHDAATTHDMAAKQLREAADLHEKAVAAYRDNRHDEEVEFSTKARQLVLEAALKSDTAFHLSAKK